MPADVRERERVDLEASEYWLMLPRALKFRPHFSNGTDKEMAVVYRFAADILDEFNVQVKTLQGGRILKPN